MFFFKSLTQTIKNKSWREIQKPRWSKSDVHYLQFHSSTKSQVYTLKFGSQKIPVYCHMGNFGCGDGGWTLAMKINGAKVKRCSRTRKLRIQCKANTVLFVFQKTFHYSSGFWSNKNSYNLPGGKTGFDDQETKLPTYWKTSFSRICLGMKIGKQIKFIVINKKAASLHSLIADGKYRATSLGRNTWKTLIGSQASLQPNCNKEGFNVGRGYRIPGARIGFLGNNEKECKTCDSWIGFGTATRSDSYTTCGNGAHGAGADNGLKKIIAMGYILVQ